MVEFTRVKISFNMEFLPMSESIRNNKLNLSRL